MIFGLTYLQLFGVGAASTWFVGWLALLKYMKVKIVERSDFDRQILATWYGSLAIVLICAPWPLYVIVGIFVKKPKDDKDDKA